MREVLGLYAFNRGLIAPLGLARTDQKRVSLSAEVMTNWIPRVLGSMSLRPGLGYIGAIYNNNPARFLPFIFATDDTALVEFSNAIMRVWINDVLLTRSGVSTAITNGTFAGNITGWTDGSDAGGSIAYASISSTNALGLTGNGTARAIAYQAVTIAAPDQTTEHGLRIVVLLSQVMLKVGTSLGDDSLINETVLDNGTHSLAFTPNTGTVYIQFISSKSYPVYVSQCTIEAAGVVTIASPYLSFTNLDSLQHDQSGDTIFLSCPTFQQRKIERRGTRPWARGWSLTLYQVEDGPFRITNISPTTMTAGGLTGNVSLTASTPVFRSSHLGALFKLINQVSGVSAAIAAQNTFTSSLKVTGAGTSRSITITLTGVWVATVSLQVSTDNSTFTDVPGQVWNGNVTGPYLDGLDGQTRYYRIGVKTGNYTSGTVQNTLVYTSGTLGGVIRLTQIVSSTVAAGDVLSDIGSTSATALWAEGTWSSYRGYPTATKIHEGRLWWAGQNGLQGSLSDNYFSFNPDVIGDAGLIDRSIGSGPVDTINWIMSLQRMILGAQGAEFSVKSSAFDTPLTPTDFTIKAASTQGSKNVQSVRIDQRGIFVDRSGIKIFEIAFDLQTYEYASKDLTQIVPELGLPGISRMAVQMKPDMRIHCVRSDGTVMLGVMDKAEDVLAWVNISTFAGASIEDVVVLPAAVNTTEDRVYYVIAATVNNATVRYLCKFSQEVECRGTYSTNALLNKQSDAFVVYTNASASTTVSGLSHLVGKSVVVWQDGVCPEDSNNNPKTYTVSASGTITLDSQSLTGVVGMPYTASWKSAKLGLQQSLASTMLNQQKRISHLGVVAAWIHPKGLRFGPTLDDADLDDLPSIERGDVIDQNVIRAEYDEQEFPFGGTWDSDIRLCILAQAPRPVTLLAAIVDIDIHN